MFVIQVVNESLLSYYILLHLRLKVNFCTLWKANLFKKYTPNLLYLSFEFHLVSTLLSAGLKSELHLLFVWEIWNFHTRASNFGSWSFDTTVRRHFKPKSGHSNEREYCKSIDRRLKRSFKEGLGSFIQPTTPEKTEI